MPVIFYSGSVIEDVTDIALPGPVFGWSQRRTYNSRLTAASTTQLGRNWISDNGDVRLAQSGSDVILAGSAMSSRKFTYNSGSDTYTPPSGTDLTLVHIGTKLELTDTVGGDLFIFYDFTQGSKSGRLDERTTRTWKAAGKTGQVYSYDTAGKVTSITSPTGQDAQIVINYVSASTWKIRSILVGPTNSEYLKVEYTYKRDGSYSSDLGGLHDLVQVKTSRKASDGTNWVSRYTQYRYFTDGSRDGKLKAVFEPDAVQRIVDDSPSDSIDDAGDILALADSYSTGLSQSIASFASRSFDYHTADEATGSTGAENFESAYGGTSSAYDETGYVKKETVSGSCASCGGGGASGVSFEYHYIKGKYHTSTNPAVNVTQWIVIEDVKDGTTLLRRNIYGLNHVGLLLRHAIKKPSTSDYWCRSRKYDSNTSRRVTEERSPAAHASAATFDIVKFLNPTSDGTTWTDDPVGSTGLITLFEYNSSGWPSGAKVKNGSGTAYYVSATDYGGTGIADWDVSFTYEYPAAQTSRTGGSEVSTGYAYTYHDTAKKQRKTRDITRTAVPSGASGENGPGSSAVTKEYHDTEGRLRWMKDAEGYVNYYSYKPADGGIAYIVADVTTSSLSSEITSGSSGKWLAWSGSAGLTRESDLLTALDVIAKTEYDDQGRQIKQIDPNGGLHYVSYLSDRVIRFPYYQSGMSPTTLLPIEVTRLDGGGQQTDTYALNPSGVTITTTSSNPTGLSGEDQSDRVTWTRTAYNTHGQASNVDRYHLIPSTGAGTQITNYYRTTYTYDVEARVLTMAQDVTSTRVQKNETVYDFLGRPSQAKQAVLVSGSGTMQLTGETEYDAGGIGNGHVTKIKRFFGTNTSTDFTATKFYYTFRGHRRGVQPQDSATTPNTVLPVTLNDVDWLGRTTATAQLVANPDWTGTILSGNDGYATHADLTSQSNRRTLVVNFYDKLGRMYRSERYEIDQTTTPGAKGDKLRSDTYYDRLDRPVARVTYKQAATETVYDGAGRQYQTRVVKALKGGDSGGSGTFYDATTKRFIYCAPLPKPDTKAGNDNMTGGNDGVIQLTHQYMNDGGNTLETHTFEVNHNDSTLGIDLSNDNDYVRRSVYQWFDGADRVKTTADYGSGDTASGAGSWKYAGMPTYTEPTTGSTDSILVVTYTYDSAGRMETVERKQTSTVTIKSKTFYDDLGRRRFQVENWNNFEWTPSSGAISGTGGSTGNEDKDQTTGWEYNGLGQVTKLTAYDQNGNSTADDNQVTEYTYADSNDASLATTVKYPDSTGSTDDVEMTYALDGRVTQRTDQRQVVMDYGYNNRRQLEFEKVTLPMGSSVDPSVLRIGRTYDDLARPQKVISYSDFTGSTAVNMVEYTYDDFGQVQKVYQNHSSAGSGAPYVGHAYDYTASGGLLIEAARLQYLTHPSYTSTSHYVQYDYGTADGIDDVLSRVSKLQFRRVSTESLRDVSSYLYNGTGRMVEVRYKTASVNPEVYLDYYGGATGTYANLDRFGRVKQQLWKTSSTTIDRLDYEHDLAGNRITRDVQTSGGTDRGQVYTYDGLNRVSVYKQGTIASGSITSPTKQADWTLDALGNWKKYIEKTSGSSDIEQDRTHTNLVNEITDISERMGDPVWATPGYDAAGNTTSAPSPTSPGTSTKTQGYTWDAWNRLVVVKENSGATTLATFTYDGLHRRIKKVAGSTTYHYYLSEQNQVLEERTGSGTTIRNEYVWHPYYVDAMAARYYEDLGDTYYPTHDANFNVTALVDSVAAVVERFQYTPYGQVLFVQANFTPQSPNASATDHEFLYTGRQLDPETGLFYYRARYYHQTLGRFLNRDPIEYDAGDANLYRYVRNRPADFMDPLGTDIVIGAGGVIVLGGGGTATTGAVGGVIVAGAPVVIAGAVAVGAPIICYKYIAPFTTVPLAEWCFSGPKISGCDPCKMATMIANSAMQEAIEELESLLGEIEQQIEEVQHKIDSIERASGEQRGGGGIGEGYDISGSLQELGGLVKEWGRIAAKIAELKAKLGCK